MTEQNHPLTDEIILSIADESLHVAGFEEDMRAAADWQLEECLDEFATILSIIESLGSVDNSEILLAVLRKNLRPKQQEDN